MSLIGVENPINATKYAFRNTKQEHFSYNEERTESSEKSFYVMPGQKHKNKNKIIIKWIKKKLGKEKGTYWGRAIRAKSK